MREGERRAVLTAKVKLKAGDRAGAMAALEALLAPEKRRADPPEQLVLSVVVFECKRLGLPMTVEDCVQRRGRVWPSGRRKGRPVNAQCSSCDQGAAHAFSCPGVVLRKPSQAPEVLPASQRMAKRAKALVGLLDDEPVAMDPLREADSMTPTDNSDWRA